MVRIVNVGAWHQAGAKRRLERPDLYQFRPRKGVMRLMGDGTGILAEPQTLFRSSHLDLRNRAGYRRRPPGAK
jgi:hypothetical protein